MSIFLFEYVENFSNNAGLLLPFSVDCAHVHVVLKIPPEWPPNYLKASIKKKKGAPEPHWVLAECSLLHVSHRQLQILYEPLPSITSTLHMRLNPCLVLLARSYESVEVQEENPVSIAD